MIALVAGNFGYPSIDGWVGFLVALILIYTGLDIDRDSVDDLIDCCITSSWIPVIFGGFFKQFRKGDCVDGGFSNIFSNNSHNPDYNHNWLHIDLSTFGRFENDIFTTLHSFITLAFSANENYVFNLMNQGYIDAKNNDIYFKNFKKLKKITY